MLDGKTCIKKLQGNVFICFPQWVKKQKYSLSHNSKDVNNFLDLVLVSLGDFRSNVKLPSH